MLKFFIDETTLNLDNIPHIMKEVSDAFSVGDKISLPGLTILRVIFQAVPEADREKVYKIFKFLEEGTVVEHTSYNS